MIFSAAGKLNGSIRKAQSEMFSILIDVGDDYVTGTSDAGGGDIHGGGYAYHGKASNNPDHDNQSVTTIAGDTLIEFKSGILYGLLIGGGSVNGYASTDKPNVSLRALSVIRISLSPAALSLKL